MVETNQTGKPIDFSIMPSFRCNLNCWFCMYDCSPNGYQPELDFYKTKKFIKQFDWNMINAFGFYGGEPSINTKLYDDFIALVPDHISKFVITNGTWSVSSEYTELFLNWCARHRFHIIVSSTPEHIKFQNRNFLENLQKEIGDALEIKKPDRIHAQGRAKGKPGVVTDCEFTCRRLDRNMRLGLKPDGNIVFQNCHGEYHIVQTYEHPFEGMLNRAKSLSEQCYTVVNHKLTK